MEDDILEQERTEEGLLIEFEELCDASKFVEALKLLWFVESVGYSRELIQAMETTYTNALV